jgi:hypothetical protein
MYFRGSYNEVYQRPADRFSHSLTNLLPSRIAWLMQVVLDLSSSGVHTTEMIEHPGYFLMVADFCGNNHHVTVDYVIRDVNVDHIRLCSSKEESGLSIRSLEPRRLQPRSLFQYIGFDAANHEYNTPNVSSLRI